jgi:hypothetical protein
MATMINTKSNLFQKAMGVDNTSSTESSDSEEVPKGKFLSRLPIAQVVIPNDLASFLTETINTAPTEIDISGQKEQQNVIFFEALSQVLQGADHPKTKEQMKLFTKLMKHTAQDMDRAELIRIIQKINDKQLWKDFYTLNGAYHLFRWASTSALNSDLIASLILNVIRKMPYDEDIFTKNPFLKFVRRMIKDGSKRIIF